MRIIAYNTNGSSGTWGAGVLRQQNPSDFNAPALAGNWTFGLQGFDPAGNPTSSDGTYSESANRRVQQRRRRHQRLRQPQSGNLHRIGFRHRRLQRARHLANPHWEPNLQLRRLCHLGKRGFAGGDRQRRQYHHQQRAAAKRHDERWHPERQRRGSRKQNP